MTMLAKTTETRALTLADYEARIHLYKEQIGTGYIGIGRTLNEAKEAKVVPHGQWETWVTETTGLTPRQAQRCMQAATEIRDGSALARLEMSKALMLLGSGLEADEQERIAEAAAEDGATVKALKEEIRQTKLKLAQESGTAGEIRAKLRETERKAAELQNQMQALHQGMQARLDEETTRAYQRGSQDTRAEMEGEIRKVRAAATAQDDGRVNALRNELNKQEQYNRELQRDRADLLDAAEEAEKRAAAAEAELEILRAGQSQRKTAWAVLDEALRCFLSSCGTMPFDDGEELKREWQRVTCTLNTLQDWLDEMYTAVGESPVHVEGAIE